MAYPTVTVEIAPGVGVDTDPDPGDWVDITSDVRSIVTNRGRSDERDVYQPGDMTVVLDNRTRNYDPMYTSGTHYPDLVPRVPIRFLATWSAVDYPIWRGYVLAWPQEWELSDKDATTTIECVDAFGILATATIGTPWELEVDSHSVEAWYRMSETSGTVMNDWQGDQHGTWFGGVTFSNAAGLIAADPNGALRFPGGFFFDNPPGGQVPKYAGNVSTGGAYSVAVWFRYEVAELVSGLKRFLVGFADTANDGFGIWATYNTTTNTFTIEAEVSTATAGLASTSVSVSATAAVSGAGQSHLVVLTVTAGGAANLYYDGYTNTDSDTGGGGDLLSTLGEINSTGLFAGRAFGWFKSSNDAAWRGVLDELVMFDEVLTTGDVGSIYTAGTTPWEGEQSGTRIARLLDAISFPSALYNLDSGTGDLGPGRVRSAQFLKPLFARLNAVATTSGSVLEQCQQVEATEQGRLFVSIDGKITFQGRADIITDTASNVSQHTFSDDGTSGQQSRILRATFDDTRIVNVSKVTDSRGVTHTAVDATSRALYGDRVETLDIEAAATFSEHFAEYRVAAYKDPHLRVPVVEVPPRVDDAIWPLILDLELGNMVTVDRTPQGVGTAINPDLVVEGISWEVRPGGEWLVSFNLGLHPTEIAGPWFTWGGTGSTEGWGQGGWFY